MRLPRTRRILFYVLALTLLSGCASRVPREIRGGPPSDIRVGDVQTSPSRFFDAPVRWGGEIVSVRNERTETWIELLAYPLEYYGRPQRGRESQGRFLARVKGFLDPAVYAPGRELTVAGRVGKLIAGKVGEYPYRFPLVRVESYYLWPPPKPAPAYWNDPYFDPWYPYWPYYRRHPWWW